MAKGNKTVEEQIKEAEQYFIDGKLSKALNILEPLSGQGHDRVEYLLSLIYEYGGDGIELNGAKAIMCLSKVVLRSYFFVRFINILYFKASDIPDMSKFNKDNQNIIKSLPELEKSTDPFIQFEVGIYYLKSFTGVTDMNKSIKYLKMSADQGLWVASFNLAEIYLYGINGVEQDFELARINYIEAAKKGMAIAAQIAGGFYYTGKGVDQNYEIAKHYFEIGAKQNHSISMHNLAMCYGILGDVKKAIYWFDRNVEINKDASSAAELGSILFNENDDPNIPTDMDRAVELFQFALSKDNKNHVALCYMGIMYLSDGQIDKGRDYLQRTIKYSGDDDYYGNKAKSLLAVLNLDKPKQNKTESNADKLKKLKSSFSGNYDYHNIMQAYDPDKTVEDIYKYFFNFDTMLRDYSNVVEKAAELDCDITEDEDLNDYVEDLKKILYNLRGDAAFKDINAPWKADLKAANKALFTDKKPKRAMELYQKAANAGSGEAMYQLGQMYRHFWSPCLNAELDAEMSGKLKNDKCHPVEKDINKAIEYYKKAAALDYTEAMTSLASIYKEGKDVSQDLNEAVKLYRQAALLGDSRAMLSLSAMYKEGDGVPQNKMEADFYKRMQTFDDYLECHNQLKAAFDPNAADQLTPLFAQNTAAAQPQSQSQSEVVESTESTEINTTEEDKKNEGLAIFMVGAAIFLYVFTSLGFFKSILYAFGATIILMFINKDK